jgi:ribosomal protein L13
LAAPGQPPTDIDKKWVLVDADGLVLGRLAAVLPAARQA